MRDSSIKSALVVVLLALMALPAGVWAAEETWQVTTAAELQQALTEAAMNDDQNLIKVAQGVYEGAFTFYSIEGHNLRLLGGYTADFSSRVVDPCNTILQVNNAPEDPNRVLRLENAQEGDLFVEGFTFQNGWSKEGDPNSPLDNVGGGGLCVITYSDSQMAGTITVTNCIIRHNGCFAYNYGAGIYATSRTGEKIDTQAGNINITNNIIEGNETTLGHGGGIYAETYCHDGLGGAITITGNTFTGNMTNGTEGAGGFLRTYSGGPVTLSGNTICDNSADRGSGGGFVVETYAGGGMPGGDATISDNTFHGNYAWDEGGALKSVLYGSPDGTLAAGNLTLTGNRFYDNFSQRSVGGVQLQTYGHDLPGGNIALVNNLFAGNEGETYSGIWAETAGTQGTVTLTNNTVAGNRTTGLGGSQFQNIAINALGGGGAAAALDPLVWTVVNRSNDTNVSVGTDGGHLVIFVPGGLPHAPTTVNTAPYIRQSVPNTDLSMVVKFDSEVTLKYQEQGLVVEEDQDSFIRFDVNSDGVNVKVFSGSNNNGVLATYSYSAITAGAPYYLRVERVGDQWTHFYSKDGSNWTLVANYMLALNVTSAGIFAGNETGATSPEFTCLADYFHAAAPLVSDGFNDLDGSTYLYSGNQVDVYNNIWWGNTDGDVVLDGPGVSYGYHNDYQTLTGSWTSSAGNFTLDPYFADPDGPDNDPLTASDNDYHLRFVSPCLDTGMNGAPLLPAFDLDGTARVQDGDKDGVAVVDRGVYEYPEEGEPNEPNNPDPNYFPGDCNKDGCVDFEDLLVLTENWLGVVCDPSLPWCSGCDRNLDGIVNLPDLSLLTGLEQWTMEDLTLLAEYWLNSDCTKAGPWCDGCDVNQDGILNVIDFGAMAAHWHQCVMVVLNSSAGENGTIDPAGVNSYPMGTVVNLSAQPDAGYRVASWNGTDNDALQDPCNTVTMTRDKRVSVTFELLPTWQLYTFVASSPYHFGTIDSVLPYSPDGQYLDGTNIIITAQPVPAFKVWKWQDDQGNLLQTGGNTYQFDIHNDLTVIVFFTIDN